MKHTIVLAVAAATLSGQAQSAPLPPCPDASAQPCARPHSAIPFLDSAISQIQGRIEN